MRVTVLTGDALSAVLEDVARLRIAVFRDWPYLYQGDLAYERRYLQTYRNSARTVLVAAFDDNRLVGAATGTPLIDHAQDFAVAFDGTGIDLNSVFYCAESVLLPQFRGQGIGHRFFDLREAQARAQGFKHAAFCAVIRADDHLLRPAGYTPLDRFWRKRGYAPMPGVVAKFDWTDVGQERSTSKDLQFWVRSL